MASETKDTSVETQEHHVERDKRFACGNLSERKYTSNVFILTELVIDLNAEKGDISFVILCGFSYEIAKCATLTLLLTLNRRALNVCVYVMCCLCVLF